MPTPLANLLIVDDERALMQALCDTLSAEGYRVTGFTSAAQALDALREEDFDVVLTDLMMPEMDGVSLLAAAFAIDPNLAGIVMTGHGSVNTAVDALKAGAQDYILKPFKLSAILPVLTRVLTVRQLRMENIELREAVGLHELATAIGSTSGADAVLNTVADSAFAGGKADGLAVLLATPAAGGKVLRVAAVRGSQEGTLRRLPIDESLLDWVAQCVEPPVEPSVFLRAPLTSLVPPGLSIPMLTGGKLVGILHLNRPATGRLLTPGQMKALRILAGTAASALAACSLVDRLRAAEQRYRRLAEDAPDIVARFEILPGPGFTYLNPTVTAVTGYTPEEFYADPGLVLRLVHADDRATAERILRGEGVHATHTLRCMHRTGATIWLEARSVLVRDESDRPAAVEIIARDISERKQLEEQLRHAQKLEAVGRLTAGVAHDFNNLLTVINGYSALLLQEVNPGASGWWKLNEVKKAGDQAADLTGQLLAFSRKQILHPRALDLGRILDEMNQIIRKAAGDAIEVVVQKQEGLGSVRIDPGQVRQAILNLTINARDAMPEGGSLALSVANVDWHDGECREADVPAGNYVSLTVADTGCGMTTEVRQRIFEPFFTTKEIGRGTGLGLATVYGIVEQSGGHIRVESEVGRGTLFRLYFPHCDAPAEEPVAGASAMAGGAETILVVEDEPSIRRLVHGILASVGYTVWTAADGEEAIEMARSRPGPIHLLLSDMGLPRMPGVEVARRLREIVPGIAVLFMSGFSEIAADPDAAKSLDIVRKPFEPAELCARIRNALAAPRRAARRRILVVDDEAPIRRLLEEVLSGAGWEVITASDGTDARRLLSQEEFDLVITDLVMPESEGIGLISELRRAYPDMKVVAISGAFNGEFLRVVRHLGAHATLTKPLDREEMLQCIRRLWDMPDRRTGPRRQEPPPALRTPVPVDSTA